MLADVERWASTTAIPVRSHAQHGQGCRIGSRCGIPLYCGRVQQVWVDRVGDGVRHALADPHGVAPTAAGAVMGAEVEQPDPGAMVVFPP